MPREPGESNIVSGAISGSASAAGYGLVALAVLFAVIVARRRLAAGTPSAAVRDLDAAPYAIAYLSGGPARTLMAAMASMHVAGTIVVQGHDVREVRAEERLDLNASELECAIHRTATTPIGAVALSDGGQTRPLSALHQTASASSAKAADS
jgi:uncharacterized protein (TIGR04222 family)